MMFLNFFSDLNATDRVFFAVIIGALLVVLIWYIIGKIINHLADKKVKAAKANLENINNTIKEDSNSKNTSEALENTKSNKESPVEATLNEVTENEDNIDLENTNSEESKTIEENDDLNNQENNEVEVVEANLEEVKQEIQGEKSKNEPQESTELKQESIEVEESLPEASSLESLEETNSTGDLEEIKEPVATEDATQELEETKPNQNEASVQEKIENQEVNTTDNLENEQESINEAQDEPEANLVTLPLDNEERPVESIPSNELKEDQASKQEATEELNTIEAIKPEIEVEEKKGRSYNGKYEVYQVAGGYAYHLKASNGEILVVSETFSTREGVIKAIDVVKKNLETGTIRFFSDKKGKFKFKLVSKNYRVLLISSNYPTEKSAIRASESFKKFAKKADIVDIELVDTESKTATIINIQSRENKSGGKFHIEKFNGEYSWDLKASNGQILCQADGYTTKAGCLNSIESFKKNVSEGVFKCVKDKTGRYCYKLYTQNGRVCVVGESYTTKSSAESAAASVVAFYQLADIVEIK